MYRLINAVTLPRLHHTLTLRKPTSDPARERLIASEVRQDGVTSIRKMAPDLAQSSPPARPWFLPRSFNARSLPCFSALTNIRELGIGDLDLGIFIPQAQPYFRYFSSTPQYLALRTPGGIHHQPLYFLELFPNLDDFKPIHSGAWRLLPPGPVLVP